jgi:hypothetical protein
MKRNIWHGIVSAALALVFLGIFFCGEYRIPDLWWYLSALLGVITSFWFVKCIWSLFDFMDRDFSVVTFLRKYSGTGADDLQQLAYSAWTNIEYRLLNKLAEKQIRWKSDRPDCMVLHGKFSEEEIRNSVGHAQFEITHTANQQSLPVTPDPLFVLDSPATSGTACNNCQ